MDKVISARMDESAVALVGQLARKLNTSKKEVLERAVAMLAAHVGHDDDVDIFERTSGAWSRKESPEKTVASARKAFRDSMTRRAR